jgi:hypothetical protein
MTHASEMELWLELTLELEFPLELLPPTTQAQDPYSMGSVGSGMAVHI